MNIGLVRTRNEQEVIVPALASCDKWFDKIVVIHSDVTDATLDRLSAYISKTGQDSKYVVAKYPHYVHPQYSSVYGMSGYSMENTLARYAQFGLNICKDLVGDETQGVWACLDVDQVHTGQAMDSIVGLFNNTDARITMYRSGGINGQVHKDSNTYKVATHNNRRNGAGYDSVVFNIGQLKGCRYAQAGYVETLKGIDLSCMVPQPEAEAVLWYHFKQYELPYWHDRGFRCEPMLPEELALYRKTILPKLQEHGSEYATLNLE